MINRVVLVGRLTKDVQVRKTQSNLSVASFTIAVDRRPSQGQQGQQNQPQQGQQGQRGNFRNKNLFIPFFCL